MSLLRGPREALAYLEDIPALSLSMLPGEYRLEWLDPLTGELSGEQNLACGENGLLTLTAPRPKAEWALGLKPL